MSEAPKSVVPIRGKPDLSSSELSAAERFDGYLRMREAWCPKWTARVSNEWKISFGVWTLLAAGIAQQSIHHGTIPLFILPFLIAGHCYILLEIHKKNSKDGEIALAYLREAERLLSDHSILPECRNKAASWTDAATHYAFIAQISMSLILCVAIVAIN